MAYRAFLSYSRADERVASWLHGVLDRYRTPRALLAVEGEHGRPQDRLHPIFRDRTDMAGGGALSDRFRQALEESEALLVLCSPNAAQSHWVNQEVETFIGLHGGARIFPIISADASDSDDIERDFYPPALRGRGLLAADLREIKRRDGRLVGDGREGGKLKVIAGLLGVSLDAVARRDRVRQRNLRLLWTGAACVFGALAIAAAGLAVVASNNERRANEAAMRVYWRQAADAIQEYDYPLAFRTIQEAVALNPANADVFRSQLRWLTFRTRTVTYVHAGVAAIRDISHSPNGDVIATLDETGVVRVSVLSRRRTWSTSKAEGAPYSAVAVSHGFVAAFSAEENAAISVWQANSGEAIAAIRVTTPREAGIALSPDGRLVATCDGYDVRVYEIERRAMLWESGEIGWQGDGFDTYDCVFNESGDQVASVHNGSWAIHDARHGTRIMVNGEASGIDAVSGPYSDAVDRIRVASTQASYFEVGGALAPADYYPGCEAYDSDEPPSGRFDRFFQRGEAGAGLWSERTGNARLAEGPSVVLHRHYAVATDRQRSAAFCGTFVPYIPPEDNGASESPAPATPRRDPSIEDFLGGPMDVAGVNARFLAIANRRQQAAVFDLQEGARRMVVVQSSSEPKHLAVDNAGELLFIINNNRLEVWDVARGELIDGDPTWNCASYCSTLGPFDDARAIIHVSMEGNGGAAEYEFPAPEARMSTEELRRVLCERIDALAAVATPGCRPAS